MAMINRIEADKRGEQAPIRLGDAVAAEIALAVKQRFELLKRLEKRADGFFVSLLRGRNPAL